MTLPRRKPHMKPTKAWALVHSDRQIWEHTAEGVLSVFGIYDKAKHHEQFVHHIARVLITELPRKRRAKHGRL